MKKTIPTLSLFSGAGGLDIGFHKAGFEIVACVEIEQSYCDTLLKNIGRDKFFGQNTIVHCEDITKFDPTPYKGMGIRCVIGGPPCQTFSAAGRRSGGVIGLHDKRGQLFKAYCKILKVIEPEVFVFENVYGIKGANGGESWREIVRAFSVLGYRLDAEIVDAADYGVPQHRERLIMVGSRSKQFSFPLPTHGPDSCNNYPLVSVYAAIKDLQNDSEPYHDGLGGMYGHLLPLVPEGLNYSYFTAEMGHPEPVFAWRSKFHDLLYKVNKEEPCRTIKAQPGKFTGPFHWKNRHFSTHELKRLQTFPDSYEIVGNYSKVVEQIGNSVPPRLAEVIGVSVREQLLDNKKRFTYKIRPDGFVSTFRQRQRERSNEFKTIARNSIKKQFSINKNIDKTIDSKNERYYLLTDGFFNSETYDKKPRNISNYRHAYKVEISGRGDVLDIDVFSVVPTDSRGCIQITGLKKYLKKIDAVSVNFCLSDPSGIFSIWSIIENALVSRSQFFSLIDIYGHYANRGDTVKIVSNFKLCSSEPIHRALEFFGNSDKSGGFYTIEYLMRQLGVDEQGLQGVVDKMRAIRFDIRSSKTHPIIGPGRVICTYPFPLLSAKALVESRVNFTKVQPLAEVNF